MDPLGKALQDFEESLPASQKLDLLRLKTLPDAAAVVTSTAEVDRQNAKRKGRCFASRLFGVSQFVQQFTSIVDAFVQAHPEVAA